LRASSLASSSVSKKLALRLESCARVSLGRIDRDPYAVLGAKRAGTREMGDGVKPLAPSVRDATRRAARSMI
jgi:hypothetical protein